MGDSRVPSGGECGRLKIPVWAVRFRPWALQTADLSAFLSLIDTSAGDGACHPWTGFVDRQGYGRFRVDLAHRLVLSMKLGRELAPEEVTRHGDTCTTRACCNPGHLSVGTQADNIADRDRLGRTQKGERHYRAKLTEEEVASIKGLLRSGRTHREIAGLFGVGRRCVTHIATGANWKHVQPAVSP